ncbi:MAG: sugar transferase [Lysinibacillus sp.]
MSFDAIQTSTLYGQYGKRVFDVVVALVLMLVAIPILVVTIIILLLTSGRPIFFKQVRTGCHNQPFTIWKLRTMGLHNVQCDYPVMGTDGIPEDYVFKTGEDCRITKVGTVLRRLSIDELPQLLNVLKGDMSIVGPRPEIPIITNAYNEEQARRLEVKPGLTGLAQINGRSNISHGQKIAYDLDYIEQYSLWLDLKVVLKTCFVVFARTGAY